MGWPVCTQREAARLSLELAPGVRPPTAAGRPVARRRARECYHPGLGHVGLNAGTTRKTELVATSTRHGAYACQAENDATSTVAWSFGLVLTGAGLVLGRAIKQRTSRPVGD